MQKEALGQTSDRIALGDAFQLIKEVPKGTVDLVLTSPPYGIGKEYEKRSRTVGEYMADFLPMVAECVRVLKPTGAICWETANWIERDERSGGRSIVPLEFPYLEAFSKLGMILRNRIIWIHRTTAYNGSKRIFTPSHETILWMTKSGSYSFNLTGGVRVAQKDPGKTYHVFRGGHPVVRKAIPDGIDPGDVWDIPFGSRSAERWDHPAQFPEALARRCIECFTNPGDTVLDPFAGVGTTPKVAKDLGRKWIAFEKEPRYYDQAVMRIAGMLPVGRRPQRGERDERPLQMSIFADYASVEAKLAKAGEGRQSK